MKHLLRISLFLLLVGSSFGFLNGQNLLFLELDGIDGEVTQVGFEDQICISSFSWDVSTTTGTSGGGTGASRATQEDFQFGKAVDEASAELYEALVNGRVISAGKLTIRKFGNDGQPFTLAEYVFKDLFITGLQPGGNSEDPGKEVLSLSANKVTLSYFDDKGSLINSYAWNFSTNSPN